MEGNLNIDIYNNVLLKILPKLLLEVPVELRQEVRRMGSTR